jgi:hypothetical protein
LGNEKQQNRTKQSKRHEQLPPGLVSLLSTGKWYTESSGAEVLPASFGQSMRQSGRCPDSPGADSKRRIAGSTWTWRAES